MLTPQQEIVQTTEHNEVFDQYDISFPDPFMDWVEESLLNATGHTSVTTPIVYHTFDEMIDEQFLPVEKVLPQAEEILTTQFQVADTSLHPIALENRPNKRKRSAPQGSSLGENKVYQVELNAQFAAEFPGAEENQTVAIRKRIKPDGKGSSGSVFKTVYCEKPVALKIANGNIATKKVQKEFEEEYRKLERLSSLDHIMKAFGRLKDVKGKTIGMALEPLVSLTDFLLNNPGLPVYTRISLARQCVIGLANMHQAGMFHRDIKAENMLVRADGNYACAGDVGTAVEYSLAQKKYIDTYLATTYTCAHFLLIQAAFAKEKPRTFEYNAATEIYAVLKGILYVIIMSGKDPSILNMVRLPKNTPNNVQTGQQPEILNAVQSELKPYLDNWEFAKQEDSANVNAKSELKQLVEIYNECEARSYPTMSALADALTQAQAACPPPGARLLPAFQSS